MKLQDLNLLAFGNTVQLTGAIYEGVYDGKLITFTCHFPGEHDENATLETLEMGTEDWVKFLRQSDIMETEVLAKAKDGTLTKAILRKSQRQIDANISWKVFKRDEYRCRYCGREGPLTVDHLVRWEEGGPTIEENLLSACKKCNKIRGDMSYEQWLKSDRYQNVSQNLSQMIRSANGALVHFLNKIPRVEHIRSR